METQQCALFIVAGYMFNLILSPRNLQVANNMKHTQGFTPNIRFFCPNLTKFGFSWQIFIEVAIVKFNRNLSRGNGCHTYRQTVGNDEVDFFFATTRTHLKCVFFKQIPNLQIICKFALTHQLNYIKKTPSRILFSPTHALSHTTMYQSFKLY